MSWFRLDDQISHHPKVIDAGNEAFGAWCRMGTHSASYLTDGFVSSAVALSIAGRQEVIDRLVEVRLLDVEPGGYAVHDYLDWNPPASEVRATREAAAAKKSKAGKAGAAARWQRDGRQDGKGDAVAMAGAMADGCQRDGKTMAPFPSPFPSRREEERETAQPPAAPLLRPPFGEPPRESEWGDESERHAVEQRELISDPQAPGEAQILVGLAANADLLEKVPLQALAHRMALASAGLPASVDRTALACECCASARNYAGKANKKTTAKQRAASVERALGWALEKRAAKPDSSRELLHHERPSHERY